MELTNAAADYLRKASPETRDAALCAEVAEVLCKLLAPFCPHWAEELWNTVLGHEGESIATVAWPSFDPAKAKAAQVEIAVQVSGKIKARITIDADATEEAALAAARDAVASAIDGKTLVKQIYIPGRLVNIVAK